MSHLPMDVLHVQPRTSLFHQDYVALAISSVTDQTFLSRDVRCGLIRFTEGPKGPRVKMQEREAGHLLPPNTDVQSPVFMAQNLYTRRTLTNTAQVVS